MTIHSGKSRSSRHADEGEVPLPTPARRSRTRIRVRFGAPAIAAAALLGIGLTAEFGVSANATGVGAQGHLDDALTTQLAAEARAVSDPQSPEFRHFQTPAQVAKYLPGATAQHQRAASGGLAGDLMRSQRVDAGAVVAGSGGGDAGALSKPCSAYFGELTASRYPAAFGTHLPLAICGYTPAQLRSAYDTDDATGRGATVAIVDAYGSPTIERDANEYATRRGDRPFAVGQYSERVDPKAWTVQDLCGGTDSWAAEQTLDVEAVHALAPDARILYYGANSCQDSDLLAALTDLIGHHLADVITASWGGPIHSVGGDMSADVIARYDRLFQIAALEGITVDFSSGDCGDNAPTSTCGGPQGIGSSEPQTSYPAADPWVTAVGGTSLEIGRGGEIDGQTAWGTRAWRLREKPAAAKGGPAKGSTYKGSASKESGGGSEGVDPGPLWQPLGWIFGGGGGTSADFAQPWYQAGHVPAALSGTLLTGNPATSPRRTVPDLALDADPFTGMLVGQTVQSSDSSIKSGTIHSEKVDKETGVYKETTVGGTSLASPLLAGLEADAIEADCGADLGFVNPSLYLRAHTTLLHDVTGITSADNPADIPPPGQIYPPIPGKAAVLASLGDDGPLLAAPGYDAATGLGAPGDDFPQRLGAH